MTGNNERQVDVFGAGLVGLTCAKMLLDCGWSVRLIRTGQSHSRPIALSEPTAQIFHAIWGCALPSICPVHSLTVRRVAWSEGDTGQDVDVSVFSIDIADLCEGLEARLGGRIACEDVQDSPDPSVGKFAIDARGATPPDVCRMTTGQRVMHLWRNVPAEPGLTGVSEILSGPGFWIYLLPTGSSQMSVQIATPGGPPDIAGLAERLASAPARSLGGCLARTIEDLTDVPFATASIAPRLGLQMRDAAHLPVGDRALSFDPICGDGTGQGLRTGILGVAALNALVDGHATHDILRHVRSRHLFTFTSHLKHCLRYYRTIAHPEYWSEDIVDAQNGLNRARGFQMHGGEPFRLYYERPGSGVGPKLQTAIQH